MKLAELYRLLAAVLVGLLVLAVVLTCTGTVVETIQVGPPCQTRYYPAGQHHVAILCPTEPDSGHPGTTPTPLDGSPPSRPPPLPRDLPLPQLG